jgi:hypothetical protein
MNGFASHGLDEDRFAEKGSIVSAFDAFREFSSFVVIQNASSGPSVQFLGSRNSCGAAD